MSFLRYSGKALFSSISRSYAAEWNARISTGRFVIQAHLKEVLAQNGPVVALESTILTHGMPFPENLEMARSVENIIRQAGAEPATIALLSGKVHIGLTDSQLAELADSSRTAGSECVKVSRRDIAYTLNQGLLGGTTISATMFLAHKAGIKVFVSGGLGGVHRGGESSMDISADLTELGKTPVALVTSGVKSILDIGRTLEFLETQGVCVATFGPSTQFPAFFTRDSGHHSICNLNSYDDAAQLIHTTFSMDLNNGILIANPIAEEYEVDGHQIEECIQRAVTEAADLKIKGKAITPYVLQQVNQLTQGRSLKANVALVESNALVGAEIAVRLSKLENCDNKVKPCNPLIPRQVQNSNSISTTSSKSALDTPRVAVVGASNLDCVLHLLNDSVQFHGHTNNALSTVCSGGVGRNLCDGLSRLGFNPLFLSAVGNDVNGEKIISMSKYMDWSNVLHLPQQNTAYYTVILDSKGDLYLGVGDMNIHDQITPQYIKENDEMLKEAPLIIMDGNLSLECMKAIGEIASEHQIPIFYEPTDIEKASKPFIAGIGDSITFIKPNLKEFKQIYYQVTGHDPKLLDGQTDQLNEQLSELCTRINIPCILITLGTEGVLCYKKHSPHLHFPFNNLEESKAISILKNTEEEVCIHVAARPVDHIASVSGAGDCMAIGFICGYLRRQDLVTSVLLGSEAARLSLLSYDTVPNSIQCLHG